MTTEKKENSSKQLKALYGIIAILLLGLVIETGLLIRSNNVSTHHIQTWSKTSRPNGFSVAQTGKQGPSTAFSPGYDTTQQNPLESLRLMQERMNRFFNAAMTYGPHLVNTWNQSMAFDFMPSIDLEETDDAYIVTSDLPGLDKDKINITVSGTVLTLKGVRETSSEKKDEHAGFYAQERSYGTFARQITLPGPVDEGNIKAEYENGVLTITLPKAAGEKASKQVTVQ